MIAPAYNEGLKIGEVVRRCPRDAVDEILVVDDGSTDNTAEAARAAGARVISLGRVAGVGVAIRRGLEVARHESFDVAVVIAGNNKDDPTEVVRLLDPICERGFDFVMGSRFLAGGFYGGDMPAYRKFAVRVHPFLVGLMCGRRITESTNGYRAIHTAVLADPRINLYQSWLDHYELEVYLLMRVLQLGYRTCEVPVSKTYPRRDLGYTKMRPVVDWWKMLRPIFIVGLGMRR
jgi:dolichol-phosphate mannosyltransferase